MKPSIFVIPVLLLPALIGCVPNAVGYYRPSVEGGKIVSGRCVPIESAVELEIGSIPVHVGVSGQHVLLAISKMPGKAIRFSSDAFKLRDLTTGRRFDPRSVEVYRDDGAKSLTLPYPQEGSEKSARSSMSFWIYVNLPQPMPDSFELAGPSIIVDGIEKTFPVIRFEHKVWVGISPFNC